MSAAMGRLFARWGEEVRRASGGESWKAFVQPVRQKKEREDREATPLGDVDRRRWLYIGPGEQPLDWDEEIICCGERYRARECAAVRVGGETVYQRAILMRGKAGAE